MNQQPAGVVLPRQLRRGHQVPDVRNLMGIKVTKGYGEGNLNTGAYQTDEDKLALFFKFLRIRGGLSELEFETVFVSPLDQGVEVNMQNENAGSMFGEWAGMRREYYYLSMMVNSKHTRKDEVQPMLDKMKSIKTAIADLRTEWSDILEDITSRHGVALEFPKIFDEDLACWNGAKPKRAAKK